MPNKSTYIFLKVTFLMSKSVIMKNIILLSLITFSFSTYAEVFSSTVDGLTIANAHELVKKPGRVIRGSEPKKKLSELIKLGVTDVVLFKNDVKGEVKAEIAELKKAGIKGDHVLSLPFKWKDITDEEESCEQALTALNFLIDVAQTKGSLVYFHCTAGEDRTGLLAGIFRMAYSGWTMEKAYSDEMCEHGFAHGNSKKPFPVAKTVQVGLGEIFQKLALIINTAGKLPSYPLSLCKQMDKLTIKKPLDNCNKSSFAE